MHFIPGLRLRADEESEILGIDDAEMGEFAYDYVGIDAGANHAFRDDIHSHGDVPPTTGGREPHHTHTQTVVVNNKDKESTGAYSRMVLSRSGKSRITDTVRVAYLVRLSPRPCFQDSLDYPKFPHKWTRLSEEFVACRGGT